MRIIYIAGKFRGPTAWDIEQNVRAAEVAGLEVAKLGAFPVIPHANTRYFHGSTSDRFMLDGTLELMRRCDAVYVPHWADAHCSEGTKGEIAEAKRMGKPVLTDIVGVRSWIEFPGGSK